jgi:hypothetical protein
MATPKCSSCGAFNNLEAVDIQPKGYNYPLVSIQCATCGSIVGVMESHNITQLIYTLAKKLKLDLNSRY